MYLNKVYTFQKIYIHNLLCHLGSYKLGKPRSTLPKGRHSAAESSQLRRAGQYKRYVQYNFKFTSVYSDIYIPCKISIMITQHALFQSKYRS